MIRTFVAGIALVFLGLTGGAGANLNGGYASALGYGGGY
jgi:hypothetical protein